MPYICMIREDIPAGILQVLDLSPNTSQRSLIYEPPGQTKYVTRLTNDTVAALSGTDTTGTFAGLAAYLIDNVIDSGGATITVTVANDSAAGLIAILDAGTDLTLAVVNADLVTTGGAGAGTELDTGGSTGTLANLLKVMAGGEYVLPSGSTVGGLAAGAELGEFTDGQFRHTYESGALNISLGEGHLSEFVAATFEYDGTAGAAVVVLDDDGTVMP
ncbi:hypothetical protein N9917_03175 [Deltaproteobacteria bacterium]|nr:hypothetical protein [Deltaproteobacteria bacterium]